MRWTSRPATGSAIPGGFNSESAIECTYRAAIEEANAGPTINRIHYDIPTSDPGHAAGVWTIVPGTAVPQLTAPVTVDATTQLGYVSTPVVRIDGNSTSGADGVSLGPTADSSAIRGLMITRFDNDGVHIASGADGVIVADNWIGSDNSGSPAMGNGDDGIDVLGVNAVIDGNVINHSSDEGIDVRASGATITGNLIGLEADGAGGAGNTDVGIAIFAGGTTIGGDTPAERNVISMNWEAVEVNSSNNVIQGNYIGTDATGVLDRGNRIGDGIEIRSGTGNLVGGPNSGEGNLIAFNQLAGVDVTGGSSHTIIGNTIRSNGGLGIDLGVTGITVNDPGDVDSGANDLLNFPVVTDAQEKDGTVMVDFDLDVPAGNYRIELYTNPGGADPSGNGEGEVYESATTITHGGTGSESFVATFSGAALVPTVTATATFDDAGTLRSTSEFSGAAGVNHAPVVTNPGNQTDAELDVVSLVVAGTDPDLDTLTWSTTGLPPALSINPSTGEISGTLSASSAGTHNVTVTALDGNGGIDSESFTWTVTELNQAPIVTNPGDQSDAENDVISLTIVGSDPISTRSPGRPPGYRRRYRSIPAPARSAAH